MEVGPTESYMMDDLEKVACVWVMEYVQNSEKIMGWHNERVENS